jgi:GntR family transcriptional regulator
MIIRIDTTSSIPVYAQIVDQIKRAIASGALRHGESLPSLRETAVKLRVNPLTVSKAYKQLENDGLIETRHGLGSFVSAEISDSTDGFRRELLVQGMDALLQDAAHLGVSVEELKQLLDERAELARDGFTTHNSEEDGNNEQ